MTGPVRRTLFAALVLSLFCTDGSLAEWRMPRTHPSIVIRIVVRPPAEISAWGLLLGPAARGRQVLGFTLFRDANRKITCDVFVPPLTAETLAIWRHEIRHCYEPWFHQAAPGHP